MHRTSRITVLLLTTMAALIAAGTAAWYGSAPPRSIADFRPSQHGFRFVNSFKGSSLPKALRDRTPAFAPTTFGLCGGMSAAAADYYLAGKPIPDTATQPAQDTPLYDYIYARQTESFGSMFNQVLRFAAWMRAPDEGPQGTQARTLNELPAILSALEKGQPVMLGLVLVAADADLKTHRPGQAARELPARLWNNHQVLAYRVESDPAKTGAVNIGIYDPNYPNADNAVIRCRPTIVAMLWSQDVSIPIPGIACTRIVPGRRETPIRGVFTMPYEAKTPPDVLR